VVGEGWQKQNIFVNVPCLQYDKQQDGRCTNDCLKFLLLMIMNSWIGQLKFGTDENCNNFTHYIQNNSSFK
jgi:hypothetical protein